MAKSLTTAALMTAVMAVLSQLAVPIPFAGVVLSLGTFGVFLTGLFLEPKFAVLSMGAYVLLGAVGVPVFAGFAGGVGVILGPTGGFIIAYPVMAFITAVVKGKNLSFARSLFGCFAAIVICYIYGSVWYCFYSHISIKAAFLAVGLPFLPFDAAKAIMAVLFTKYANTLFSHIHKCS